MEIIDMDSKPSDILGLARLINDAVQLVDDRFKASSYPYVPSLDDTREHPLDSQMTDPELRTAIQTIEGACAQLVATVARPSHTMINRFHEVFSPYCLHVAMKFKIADILDEKPEGVHVAVLGEKAGIDSEKLGRILRLLATRHVFREVSPNVFANNRLSTSLRSTNPVSSFGLHITEETAGGASTFSEVLADPEWGYSRDPRKSPFNRYMNVEEPMFEYWEKDIKEAAEMGQRFGIGMQGWGKAIEAGNVVYEYPWDKLPNGASVCDVGAGVGNITLQLAKAHPHLKLKLQDLPAPVAQAREKVWPAQCPEAIAEDRIEFKALDFFTESPIANCDVYYLKNILHNWVDGDSIKILSGIQKVMGSKSRVLIHEYILQYACSNDDTESDPAHRHSRAPPELLPNYGAGRIRQYNLDITMLSLLNSRERTLEDFIRLGRASGLEFVKLWDFGEMSVVELRKARCSKCTISPEIQMSRL